MKKSVIIFVGLIFAFALVTDICAQTPPKPDKQQPTAPTHVGSVVSIQGSTLTVTGGKGGQMGFNIATAAWQGYSSASDVKAGDNVKITYLGTVDGLNKAISVAKQGKADAKGIRRPLEQVHLGSGKWGRAGCRRMVGVWPLYILFGIKTTKNK